MSKSFRYPNHGTCSRETLITLNEDHTIESIQVVGGCNGNLKGIGQLVEGMDADEVIARLEGTTCGMKKTSCPDQLAQALRAAKENGLFQKIKRRPHGRFSLGRRFFIEKENKKFLTLLRESGICGGEGGI